MGKKGGILRKGGRVDWGERISGLILKEGEEAAGRGEGGKFGSERGGVGEGEKPKLEELTEEEMIRAKVQDCGEGPRMEGTDRLGRAK